MLKPFFRLRIVNSEIDESRKRGEAPLRYVRRMAREKWKRALKIRAKTRSRLRSRTISDSVLVAADTTVYLGSRVLGKARDAQEALKFLKLLSGRIHRVATAVAVGRSNVHDAAAPSVFVVISSVRFRKLGANELKAYIQSGEWKGKAGAYAVQGRAAHFVDQIRGSLTNIIGLPLNETLRAIHHIRACRVTYGEFRSH